MGSPSPVLTLVIVSRCCVERPPTLLLWVALVLNTSTRLAGYSDSEERLVPPRCALRRQGRQVGGGGGTRSRSEDPGYPKGLAVAQRQLPAKGPVRTPAGGAGFK